MSEKSLLIVASLLSIVLMSFHLTDDAFHTREGVFLPVATLILLVWLYGTLVLAGRRSGYVVQLVGGLFGTAVPYLHVMHRGGRITPETASAVGSYFFVWGLTALGLTSSFALVLSLRGLWSLRAGRAGGRGWSARTRLPR